MTRPIGISRRQKMNTLEGAVGTVVAQYRIRKRFSQSALADQLCCDISYISQLERGLINPSLRRILEIAEALGMDAAKLIRKVSHEFERTESKRLKH
jgi:transcriptional regulator with XRE-family HTH domain